MMQILLVLATQTEDLESWIQDLRSPDIERRERAVESLKKAGRRAMPILERAVADTDSEVSLRAKEVIRFIRLEESLTPNLKALKPDLADRLSRRDSGWTAAFLDLIREKEYGRFVYPTVRREELELLVERAVRGARDADDLARICAAAGRWKLTAARGIAPLLAHEDGAVRSEAAEAIAALCELGQRKWGRAYYSIQCREKDPDYSSLNGIRSQEAWGRLRDTQIPAAEGGTRGELFQTIAKACGLKVDSKEVDGLLLGEYQEPIHRRGTERALYQLRRLLPRDHGAILEADTMRIVRIEQARKYWADWLKE